MSVSLGIGGSSVPIIDLGLVLNPTSAEEEAMRAEHLAALARSCQECGTFAVRDHGFPSEISAELLALAAEYFSLPTEEKEDMSRDGDVVARGYRYHAFPNGRRHETYHWNEDHDRVRASGVGDPGPDPWPQSPARFRDVVRSAVAPFKELSRRVYQAVALSAGLAPDSFGFLTEFGSMQLHRYDVGTGLSEHTDLAPLTIVFADTDGLEVKYPDDRWAAASSTGGVFSCMLGDAAMYLTNDRYTTSVHRVANIPTPRRSVLWASFCGPNATIGPLPGTCSDSQPPRYEARPVEVVVREWVAQHT